MVTRSFARCVNSLRAARVLLITCAVGVVAGAGYAGSPEGSSASGEKEILLLRKHASLCKDDAEVARTRYKIGVLLFKADRFAEAVKEFQTLTGNVRCPIIIRAFALNMAGQSYRLMGDNPACLRAFADLIRLLATNPGAPPERLEPLRVIECFARFARAEVFELQKDYAPALSEYEGIIRSLADAGESDRFDKYLALACDRAATLCWLRGDQKKYDEYVSLLVRKSSGYDRTPLVKLERLCVLFARKHGLTVDASKGVSYVPAQVIGYVREKGPAPDLAAEIKKLCDECSGAKHAGIVIYHYAGLLDAMGKTVESRQMLDGLLHRQDNKAGHKDVMGRFKDVEDYARIQYAIQLGEEGKYRQAQRDLQRTAPVSANPHVVQMTEAVGRNLDILGRGAGYEDISGR